MHINAPSDKRVRRSPLRVEESPYARAFALLLALVGFVILASLVVSGTLEQPGDLSWKAFWADPTRTILSALSWLGDFIYRVFLWPSFYIPIYLFCCSFLLYLTPYRKGWLAILTGTVPGFLTLVLLAKLASGGEHHRAALSRLILTGLGKGLGITLVSLLLFVQLMLLARLGLRLKEKGRRGKPRGRERVRRRSGSSVEGDLFSPDELGAGRTYGVDPGPADGDWNERGVLSASDKTPVPTEPSSEEPSIWIDTAADAVADVANGPAWAVSDPEEDHARPGLEDESPASLFPGIEDAEFERIETQLSVARPSPARPNPNERRLGNYGVPIEDILKDYKDSDYWKIDAETRGLGDILMETLQEFKIEAELTGIRRGPVVTLFEILPSPGVKLSRIVNLADNIALRLAASRVRIVAPIPGKHAVGIEIPNKRRAIVSFREMISLELFKDSQHEIPLALGKGISGEAHIIDLVQTPHLLIAGATGSGKSVCVNALIASILYQKNPQEVKLLLIDPKIVELKMFNNIPHLLTPVVTDPRRCFQALQYCLYEMERRYSLLDSLEVRDIRSFNRKVKGQNLATAPMPYIVIVIDEFADLLTTTGKEMEATIARLAAMSRAVGLHLVLATQRPSVDVITGLIKANIPSRVAFMVASKFDSRIIIDTVGAEKLLGKGDMLFSSAWDPVPLRMQGTYISEEEVEALAMYIKTLGEPEYIDEDIFWEEDEERATTGADVDPLMDKALDIVVAAGKASASYLQRRLKIGYNRAARLVEQMEARGIVGPANGSKPRDILHVPDR
jgi:S-DNA-T family DNA segregation ATPase FtsK/SpoIIIE